MWLTLLVRRLIVRDDYDAVAKYCAGYVKGKRVLAGSADGLGKREE